MRDGSKDEKKSAAQSGPTESAMLTAPGETHHSLADYSVYEGMTVRGAPAAVYARGELVARDGEPTEAASR